MIVTDPQGRRSGYNPFTQQSYNEIPGATYFTADSISSPDDATVYTAPEVRFEGLSPISGRYQVQVFAASKTAYQLTTYNFDSTGTINGIANSKGNLAANTSTVVAIDHTANAVPVRYSALNITKADFFDTKRRDFAFLQGQIKPADGKAIHSINQQVSIKVGPYSKTVALKSLFKFKAFGHTYYSYIDWGRNGMAFEIDADTGNFALYVNNVDLDNANSSLTTDVSVKIDDVYAESLVTFKNIVRKKNDRR